MHVVVQHTKTAHTHTHAKHPCTPRGGATYNVQHAPHTNDPLAEKERRGGAACYPAGPRRHARAAMRPSLSLPCNGNWRITLPTPPPCPSFPAFSHRHFRPSSLPPPSATASATLSVGPYHHAAPQCRCRMLYSFKQLLLKQRDIMVALTNRIAERDATIASLEVCACCTPRVGWRILKVAVQMWPQ